MKNAMVTAAMLAVMATPPAALAQAGAAGDWTLSGKVDSLAFTLDCHFSQAGQALTGACVDGKVSDPKIKSGRSHPLTSGSVDGGHIRWTYQSSFLLAHFTVIYAGVRRGDVITGDIDAQGHKGLFTAHRAG